MHCLTEWFLSFLPSAHKRGLKHTQLACENKEIKHWIYFPSMLKYKEKKTPVGFIFFLHQKELLSRAYSKALEIRWKCWLCFQSYLHQVVVLACAEGLVVCGSQWTSRPLCGQADHVVPQCHDNDFWGHMLYCVCEWYFQKHMIYWIHQQLAKTAQASIERYPSLITTCSR